MLTKVHSSNKNLDFEYFVNLALVNKLSWESLIVILNDWTPTLAKSKEVIEILVNELQKRESHFQNCPARIEETIETVDQTNENIQLVESHDSDSKEFEVEFEATEYENQTNYEGLEDDFSTIDFSEATQSNEDFQSVNQTDEIVYDESSIGDISGEIGNEWYTLIRNDNSEDFETEKQSGNDRELELKAEEKQRQNKTSISEGSIDQHSSELNKQLLQCLICHKVFKSALGLKYHEKIHLEEKCFQCQTCQKSFRTSTTLKAHERIHTGEIPHECMTCKKRFKLTSHLKRHEQIHKKGEWYECMTCKKTFNRFDNLKTHEKIHTREVPYQCKTCKKRFKEESYLKSHERIHISEEPSHCDDCGKQFSQSGVLAIHRRIHHRL